MNITNFSLKLNGFPIKETQNKLREIQNISEQNYEAYVSKAKEDILLFHLKNNPFYKSVCKKGFTTWNELPVLTKSDLQAPLKDRLSNGYTLKSVYVNKTSGSTGNPFYFAKDKFTHALTWSIIQNRFNWHGLYGEKQARFYGLPSQTMPKIKERTKDYFANRYRFNVFDLSDDAFEKWIEKFKDTKFVYLNGYTTVIVAFANYLNSKSIVLKDVCPSLKACVVTSEMCFEEDKTAMNSAFGIPIVNEYGASELDLIAFQNTKNQWIINTESLFIEIVDDNNTPLPYGQLGRIIVTSLYNKAHPFIRYELGDLGILKKNDSKTILLEKLEGRREDIVRLPSGKIAPGLSFYYVTKSIMKDTGTVKEIKVVQTTLNTFEIHYASDNELSEKQMSNVRSALYEYLEPNLEVVFYRFNQLERSKSGKLKQFTSLIKQ
jgi:phenylacetate-CoA ligase